MSPKVAQHNREKCGNIAALSTATIPWDRDRYFATAQTAHEHYRRYGKTAEMAESVARKAGGHNIRVYSATLRARVK
jgi:hypothetical protein